MCIPPGKILGTPLQRGLTIGSGSSIYVYKNFGRHLDHVPWKVGMTHSYKNAYNLLYSCIVLNHLKHLFRRCSSKNGELP
jgi:hypothetical protein